MKTMISPLSDLNLDTESEKKVRQWLEQIIEIFKEKADGRVGNVFHNDFENDKIFFYTDCTDLINKEKDEEANLVRTRKRFVFLQLFLKYLLGERVNRTMKCSHCGDDEVFVDDYGGGSFRFCASCGMIVLYVHPSHYEDALKLAKEKINKILEGE